MSTLEALLIKAGESIRSEGGVVLLQVRLEVQPNKEPEQKIEVDTKDGQHPFVVELLKDGIARSEREDTIRQLQVEVAENGWLWTDVCDSALGTGVVLDPAKIRRWMSLAMDQWQLLFNGSTVTGKTLKIYDSEFDLHRPVVESRRDGETIVMWIGGAREDPIDARNDGADAALALVYGWPLPDKVPDDEPNPAVVEAAHKRLADEMAVINARNATQVALIEEAMQRANENGLEEK